MAYPGARRGSVVAAKVVSYEARNRVTWGDALLWAVDGFKTHLAPNFRRHRGFPSLAAQHPPLLQVLKGRTEGARAAELSAGSVKAQFCGGLSVLPQAGALASASFQASIHAVGKPPLEVPLSSSAPPPIAANVHMAGTR